MRRALSLLAAGALVLVLAVSLAGCGGRLTRRAGNQPADNSAPAVGGTAPAASTGPAPANTAGLNGDLSTLDTAMSDVDKQLAQADQTSDADN
jgi:hypothetical protein